MLTIKIHGFVWLLNLLRRSAELFRRNREQEKDTRIINHFKFKPFGKIKEKFELKAL